MDKKSGASLSLKYGSSNVPDQTAVEMVAWLFGGIHCIVGVGLHRLVGKICCERRKTES